MTARPIFHAAAHRRSFDDALAQVVSKGTAPLRVLDVGSGDNLGKDMPARYGIMAAAGARGVDRTSLDVIPLYSPRVVGTGQSLPFKESAFDIVLLESVLEHVRPFALIDRVVAEAHRVLRPGGVLCGWVPAWYLYHGSKYIPDHSRFTHEGVESFLAPFSSRVLEATGGPVSVMLDIIPVIGRRLRRNGVERLETQMRYRRRPDEARNRTPPSLGYRFAASK